MIQQIRELDEFKKRLHESFQLGSLSFSTMRLARHSNVYVCGDPAETAHAIPFNVMSFHAGGAGRAG